jgi:hypothetical protein
MLRIVESTKSILNVISDSSISWREKIEQHVVSMMKVKIKQTRKSQMNFVHIFYR